MQELSEGATPPDLHHLQSINCPPNKGKIWIQSADRPGLYLEIRASGRRTWFGYTCITRSDSEEKRYTKQHRRKLGNADEITYFEARRRYDFWVLGFPKKTQSLRVGQCFDKYYCGHLVPKVSRSREYLQAFNRYWPDIASLKTTELNTKIVRSWLESVRSAYGKETANKQFTILKACLKWCAAEIDDSLQLPKDPFTGIKKYASKPANRYLKQGDEAERLERALNNNPGMRTQAIRILQLTGQRKSNVLSMRWQDIDLECGTWTIPALHHKSGRSVTVPITSSVIGILNCINKDSIWVFPSDNSESGHIENIDYWWREIRAEAGLPHLRIHDLRHTVGTILGQQGVSAFVIQKILGHANVTTTQRYTHMDLSAATAALEQIQAPRKV